MLNTIRVVTLPAALAAALILTAAKTGTSELPTASLQAGGNAVTAALYADGSVDCSGADDLSQRVGTVVLRPVPEGISFRVILTRAAPDWPYYVELSRGGTCQAAAQFSGFSTGQNGQGVFAGVYPAVAGEHAILVDVVSASTIVPLDPTQREIAPGALLDVSVPAGDSTLLTLGFDAERGPLPWSEPGFTFHGGGVLFPSMVSGQALEQVSYGGFFPFNSVVLTREGGASFDAVSLDVVELWYSYRGEAWVESNLGGYQEIWPGTNLLSGPEWVGITDLFITTYGFGDGGGTAAYLRTDSYVVRTSE